MHTLTVFPIPVAFAQQSDRDSSMSFQCGLMLMSA